MKKLIIFLLFLVSCSPETEGLVRTEVEYGTGHNYVVVDGMPCLIYDGYKQQSMTCDWSKWQGTVEDGIVVLQNDN